MSSLWALSTCESLFLTLPLPVLPSADVSTDTCSILLPPRRLSSYCDALRCEVDTCAQHDCDAIEFIDEEAYAFKVGESTVTVAVGGTPVRRPTSPALTFARSRA